jgi:hypothetical protein
MVYTFLDVLMSSQYFVTHFLNEVLSHHMAYIDHFPLIGDPYIALGILFSCVVRQPSYFT